MRQFPCVLTGATPVTVLLAVTAVLTGCGLTRPFIGNADAIDETSEQVVARIRLSPPQVFTREQLINDRMRENGFLVDQLDRAASAPLGNSLSRDLQVITTLAAQLSVNVDPVAKLNFQRAVEQTDLQQQVNAAQLKTQLLVLQAQVAQISAAHAAAEATSAAASAVSAAAASGPLGSTTVAFGGSTAGSDARLTALTTRLDEALKALATMAAAAPRDNLVKGTLEDDFEDRLALRSRIRDVINATSLDDAHDVDGNSLYHLQFKATVAPGPKKAQYGIASMSFGEADMEQQDFDLLYHTWLAAITNRMNQNLTRSGGDGKEPLNYSVLGPLTGLYDVARLPLSDDPTDVLQLAVHPNMRHKFEVPPEEDKRYALRAITQQMVVDKAKSLACWRRLVGKEYGMDEDCTEFLKLPDEASFNRFRQRDVAFAGIKPNSADATTPGVKPSYDSKGRDMRGLYSPEELVQHARNVLAVAPSIEVAVHALGDRSVVLDDTKKKGKLELQKFREAFEASSWLYERLHQTCTSVVNGQIAEEADKAKALAKTEAARLEIEQSSAARKAEALKSCEGFNRQAIATTEGTAPGIFHDALEKQSAELAAFPYNVDPTLRVQRVSTVASAANALELAAGLSGQVPSSGVSLNAGLGYSRRAAGRVDTLERVPEVIGFAGRSADDKRYEFGWVFGPRLVADTQGNEAALRQQTRTVPVSADVSVPGWWTRAKLTVNVAWKGKFDGAGALLDTDKPDAVATYTLPVRFRLNRASYDALTVTLMRAATSQGYHQARIDNVRPEVLPICKDATNSKVTLLIYGVDLWRNPRVFLGGAAVPTEGITVLPDMSGLSATVDVSTLSKPALRADSTLVVWTNHGVAEATVRTQVSSNCEGSAGQPGVASETTLATTIERVSPNQISSCDDSVTFAVSGRGLVADPQRYRFGTREASKAPFIESKGKVNTVAVSFSELSKANVGVGKPLLSMVGSDGIVSVPVEVVTGKCEASPAATYAFKAAEERIVVNSATGNTGAVGVKLTLPAGKKPTVSISVGSTAGFDGKGGELVGKKEKTLSAELTKDGTVAVTSSADLKEKSGPIAVRLSLRNLRAGDAVVLTAKGPKGATPEQIGVTVPVVAATLATPAATASAPSAAAAK